MLLRHKTALLFPAAPMYTFSIHLYTLILHFAALFHPKAKRWVEGRRNWRTRYAEAFQPAGKVLWVHAASLGEFEQGRPVMEAFRQRYPNWRIVLTFFSPSGYEIRKNYPGADFVCYLPADTPGQVRDFLDWLRPELVIMIKYEFWANYLFALRRRKIPVLLISGLFRPEQRFFKPWGGFWRRVLGCFTHFFVQNEQSQQLLAGIGLQNSTLAGDTRIDRVLQLAGQAPENERVRHFAQGARVLIAGSSWEADERILADWLRSEAARDYKLIVAPHEPSEAHLRQLEALLPVPAVRYSQYDPAAGTDARVLLIDNVGMLNTLYRYGHIAFIGGGFGKGIHNTLEPAAFGLPVLFGPRYHTFEEARAFVTNGGAFEVRDAVALEAVLRRLEGREVYEVAAAAVGGYLRAQQGATERMMAFVEKSLHT